MSDVSGVCSRIDRLPLRYCFPATAVEGLAVSLFGTHARLDADHLRPILTPKTVLPLFFAVGVIFAPIGALLLWANSQASVVVYLPIRPNRT
jgi:hypothetical protein